MMIYMTGPQMPKPFIQRASPSPSRYLPRRNTLAAAKAAAINKTRRIIFRVAPLGTVFLLINNILSFPAQLSIFPKPTLSNKGRFDIYHVNLLLFPVMIQ